MQSKNKFERKDCNDYLGINSGIATSFHNLNTGRRQKMELKIGDAVKTLKLKIFPEGVDREIYVPAGTVGVICEIRDDYYLIDVSSPTIQKSLQGVYCYDFDEVERFY